MNQVDTMNVGDGIIGAAASGLVGWLASSVMKVSKSDHKELLARVDALEKELSGRMTRTEFEQAFSKVEALVKEFRTEARAEFRELKSELKRN